MRPFSSPPAAAQSTTSNSAVSTTPPPHAPLLPPCRLPAPQSSCSSSRPSLFSSSSLLLTPLPSLAGLSWSHEEARLARLANRRRDRRSSPPPGSSGLLTPLPLPLPLPSSSAQSLAQSERLLEHSYNQLSLSPPSPTPSLMDGGSSLFTRTAHQRRLWPLHSQHERDDEEEDEVADSAALGRSVSSAAAASRSNEGSSGGGGINNGRQVSDRQRQQMQYTESLSPSPLEEPHEEIDEGITSTAAAGSSSLSSRSAEDSNPLSAAILYVYSLVTTSPADVAGLRPRDFIIAIDHFTKRGWQPNMIQRGDEKVRIEVLRRLPLDEATGRRDITWARTKKNGNGNGNNGGSGTHTSPTAAAATAGVRGGGDGNGLECLIALQRLELWSSIGRWRIDEPQGAEGGGVLGAVLCCYPDPQPVSSPPPVTQHDFAPPPPDLSCARHYPLLQSIPSLPTTATTGRVGPVRPLTSSSSASTHATGSAPHSRYQ